MRAIELACARVNSSRLNRISEIIHGQSARSECGRISFDPDRALNAIDIHLRNAGKNRHALGHYGGCVLI